MSARCRASAGAISGRTRNASGPFSTSSPMRDNPVKATLASGGRAVGALVFEFFSPGIPQLCRNAGADFVLYDMEHTGLDFETLKTQVRALPRAADRADGAGAARRISFHRPRARRGRARRHGADGGYGRRSRADRRVHALSADGPPRRRVRLRARRLRRRRGHRQDRGAPRADDGDTADRNPRRARQRRGDRRRSRCRRAMGRPLRSDELHGHSGPIPASRTTSRPSIASSPPAKPTARPQRSSPPTTTGRATTPPRASG